MLHVPPDAWPLIAVIVVLYLAGAWALISTRQRD